MSTNRRRRIHADNERRQAHQIQRRRSDRATAQVQHIQRFDDTLAALMTWIAIAVLLLIATLVVVA